MAGLTAGQFLGSAAVAAVIAGGVSLIVGYWARKGTVEAARIAAQEGRAQAADERDRQTRAALVRAVTAWDQASRDEVDWSVRREKAGEARAGLIEIAMLLRLRESTPEFDELFDVLAARTEADLRRAAELWPAVQDAIVAALHERR